MKTYRRAPRVRGAKAMIAMLPNGGSVWLNLQPALVPVRELDGIARTIEFEGLRRSKMLGFNAAGAKRLARGLRRDETRISRKRLREDRKLCDRISAGDAKLGRRVDVSLMPAIRQAIADRKRWKALLRKRERRELWNQLVVLSAALLMAAYGQRGKPISENNLVIALSLVVWLFGDEVADMLSGKRTNKIDSVKGLDVWSYTAPFANLLTGWWLLSGRQHKRFITGTTDFKDFTTLPNNGQRILFAIVDLAPRIAPEHLPGFNEFKNVPVVATIQSAEFEDSAMAQPRVTLSEVTVMMGLLVIVASVSTSQPELTNLQIAWIVDTRKPSP
jgi:hypothetical protein